MAISDPSQNSFRLEGCVHMMQVTYPPTMLAHYINDHELNRLGQLDDDLASQICWAALGVCLGSIAATIQGLWVFLMKREEFGSEDFISVLLFFAALAAFIVSGLWWYIKHVGRKQLVDEIRERPKASVTIVDANGDG